MLFLAALRPMGQARRSLQLLATLLRVAVPAALVCASLPPRRRGALPGSSLREGQWRCPSRPGQGMELTVYHRCRLVSGVGTCTTPTRTRTLLTPRMHTQCGRHRRLLSFCAVPPAQRPLTTCICLTGWQRHRAGRCAEAHRRTRRLRHCRRCHPGVGRLLQGPRLRAMMAIKSQTWS